MLTFRYILLIIIVLTGLSVQAQKLVKESLDPTVTISVPEGFKRLQGDAAQARSLSFRSNMGVFIDPTGDADLVVNESHSFFDPKDIEIMKDFYKANIRNFYNKVTFIKDEVATISGKKGLIFEFTAEITEKNRPTLRKYIQAHYGLRKRRVIVATFSSDEKTRSKWAKTATAALNSLQITEK